MQGKLSGTSTTFSLTQVSYLNRCFRGCVPELLQLVVTTEESMAETKIGGSKRGFAAMDPAKQREIASKGGRASHGGGRKPANSTSR
jgi:hypothetical protein